MESHDVYSVAFSNGLWTVDYSVTPADGPVERCKITRGDRPHPDFIAAFKPFLVMARRFVELELVNLSKAPMELAVKNIKFGYHTKYGLSIRMAVECGPLSYSADNIKLITPTFYEIRKGTNVVSFPDRTSVEYALNELTKDEMEQIASLKEESFLYAYAAKREQVTLEEAAIEYARELNGTDGML